MLVGRIARRGNFAAVIGLAMVLAGTVPASAGLLDFLFGGLRHPPPPPAAPVAPPLSEPGPPGGSIAPFSFGPREFGPPGRSVGYCVRLCDGYYFPIQRSANADSAQICAAMCPASPTRIFAGADIARASAADGTAYQDLEHAFAYRAQSVPGCTCNGHSPFGMVAMKIEDDPTLRPGDIVATPGGLVQFAPSRRTSAVVPVEKRPRGRFANTDRMSVR